MTEFRLDVNRKTGEVHLWMKGDQGPSMVPIIGWENIDGMQEFAHMLLRWYYESKTGKRRVHDISNNLLWQALGDEGA